MIARGLIIKENKILFFHRFKNGKEYFVLPGGHIEEGESPAEALIREIKEETTLDIKIDKELFNFIDIYNNLRNYYFLIKKFKGIPTLSGPEKERDSETNRYILEWHDISEIQTLNIFPKILKEKIQEILK